MDDSVMHSATPASSRPGEPVWEIAHLFPLQGNWTEDEYLALNTNRLIEFSNGRLEVLPMPTYVHQLIVRLIFRLLDGFVNQHAEGDVLFAPMPVRLWEGRFREPDIIYLRPGRVRDVHGQPEGADLVMEVVSESKEGHDRDWIEKPKDYAKAGIAEYWIVDPQQQVIQILSLEGSEYRIRGRFQKAQIADSVLLPGFSIAVDDVLAIGETSQT